MGAACGIRGMQLPALLSPSARLSQPSVAMNFLPALFLELANLGDVVPFMHLSCFGASLPSRRTEWLRSRLNFTPVTEMETAWAAKEIQCCWEWGIPTQREFQHIILRLGSSWDRRKPFPSTPYCSGSNPTVSVRLLLLSAIQL